MRLSQIAVAEARRSLRATAGASPKRPLSHAIVRTHLETFLQEARECDGDGYPSAGLRAPALPRVRLRASGRLQLQGPTLPELRRTAHGRHRRLPGRRSPARSPYRQWVSPTMRAHSVHCFFSVFSRVDVPLSNSSASRITKSSFQVSSSFTASGRSGCVTQLRRTGYFCSKAKKVASCSAFRQNPPHGRGTLPRSPDPERP